MDKFEQLKALMLAGLAIEKSKDDGLFWIFKFADYDPDLSHPENSFPSFEEAFQEALKCLKSTKDHEWSLMLMYDRGWGPIFENLDAVLGKDYPTAKKHAEDKAVEFLENENLFKKIKTWEVKIQPVLSS